MSKFDPLAVGRKITVWPSQSHWNMREKGLMATIEKISLDEICIKLSELGVRLPLKERERVRIKSWTEEVLYCWDAKVLEISNSPQEPLTIAILGDGVTLERGERSGRHNPSTQRRPNL